MNEVVQLRSRLQQGAVLNCFIPSLAVALRALALCSHLCGSFMHNTQYLAPGCDQDALLSMPIIFLSCSTRACVCPALTHHSTSLPRSGCAHAAGHAWHPSQQLSTAQSCVPCSDAPQHLAAEHGQEAAVRTLLSIPGIQVNATSQLGVTAMHLACKHGHANVVALLAAAGVCVSCESQNECALCDNGVHNFRVESTLLEVLPECCSPRTAWSNMQRGSGLCCLAPSFLKRQHCGMTCALLHRALTMVHHLACVASSRGRCESCERHDLHAAALGLPWGLGRGRGCADLRTC
eukprot:1156793-Pelagomonas_calceolata.AAC.6